MFVFRWRVLWVLGLFAIKQFGGKDFKEVEGFKDVSGGDSIFQPGFSILDAKAGEWVFSAQVGRLVPAGQACACINGKVGRPRIADHEVGPSQHNSTLWNLRFRHKAIFLVPNTARPKANTTPLELCDPTPPPLPAPPPVAPPSTTFLRFPRPRIARPLLRP